MIFESIVGTTGIASNGQSLFLANNKLLTKIDRLNKKTDMAHPFHRIEDIAVLSNKMAGIYVKDDKYGIFLLNLSSGSFLHFFVKYNPFKVMMELVDNSMLHHYSSCTTALHYQQQHSVYCFTCHLQLPVVP